MARQVCQAGLFLEPSHFFVLFTSQPFIFRDCLSNAPEVQAPANLGPVLHQFTRLICGFVKIENKDSNGAADSFRGPRLPS
jgi:hypothetical protein